MPTITENAKVKIAYFNEIGLHYNLVADQIYKKRRGISNPFDKSFLLYIVAGLIAFDIGRMMGADPYSVKGSGFASRLSTKLVLIKPLLEPLLNDDILSVDLLKHDSNIKKAYEILSAAGQGSGLLPPKPGKPQNIAGRRIGNYLKSTRKKVSPLIPTLL